MYKRQEGTPKSSNRMPAGLHWTGWTSNVGTVRAPSPGITYLMCWGSALENMTSCLELNKPNITSSHQEPHLVILGCYYSINVFATKVWDGSGIHGIVDHQGIKNIIRIRVCEIIPIIKTLITYISC